MLLRKPKVNPGSTIFNKTWCQFLAFADDLVLLANNKAVLRVFFRPTTTLKRNRVVSEYGKDRIYDYY